MAYTGNFTDALRQSPVIAIARRMPPHLMVPVARALHAGGVRFLEITFDQQSPTCIADTCAMIHEVIDAMGAKLLVGAGTVLSVEQAEAAAHAGAAYALSAVSDEAVIKRIKALGMAAIPGAFSPSEILQAYTWGADVVKVFPAGTVGPEMIKALQGPMPHVPVMAVGGVDARNAADFLAAGAIGVGVGGSLVSAELAAQGRLDEITRKAQAFCAAVGQPGKEV